MSSLKTKTTIFCTAFTLLFTAAIAMPCHSPEVYRTDIIKKYVSTDSVVVSNGKMFVIEGGEPILINSLHQDENGVFMVFSLYGTCPNGHPYPAQGGCYYPGCPCSD